MATPKLVTDGSTEFEEAEMNRALMSDGTKIQVKTWHGRLHYDGADVVVDSGVDSAGVTSGAVVFNGANTAFDITLSGFTNPPVCVFGKGSASAYEPFIISRTNVLLRIGFANIDTGAQIVTGTEDTDMDFDIIIIGF